MHAHREIQTDRQTDRQTRSSHYFTPLSGAEPRSNRYSLQAALTDWPTRAVLFQTRNSTVAEKPRGALCQLRCDTRCYFNVRSKADISQLNLPHGNRQLKKCKNREKKLKSKKMDMLRSSRVWEIHTVNLEGDKGRIRRKGWI